MRALSNASASVSGQLNPVEVVWIVCWGYVVCSPLRRALTRSSFWMVGMGGPAAAVHLIQTVWKRPYTIMTLARLVYIFGVEGHLG